MKSIWEFIWQDWRINKETSLKSRLVLVFFRTAQYFGRQPFPISLVRFVYQILIEWIMCIDLPWDTHVGSRLQLQHGFGLVVNHGTRIGENCILRHCTTIGNKITTDGIVTDCPIIEDNVEIGANVIILGPIHVGEHAVIGAGSVVVKDVPAYSVVAGNPAKVIGFKKNSTPLVAPLCTSQREFS